MMSLTSVNQNLLPGYQIVKKMNALMSMINVIIIMYIPRYAQFTQKYYY